jgi:gamma-glutamyltranspeptidase/glutathione hydrolase
VSNLNGPATAAEPAFLVTPEAAALEGRGHQLSSIAAIGNVTGVAFLADGRMQAAAEPERQGGGSAVVLRPAG